MSLLRMLEKLGFLMRVFFPPASVPVVKDDTGTPVRSFNTESVRKAGAFYLNCIFTSKRTGKKKNVVCSMKTDNSWIQTEAKL